MGLFIISRRLKSVFVITGVVFTFIGLLSQLSFVTQFNRGLSMKQLRVSDLVNQYSQDSATSDGDQEIDTDDHMMTRMYETRQARIRAICDQNFGIKQRTTHNYCLLPNTNNASYCKVPKCGSTMWMKIYNILKNGIKSAETIIDARRFELHRNYTCQLLAPTAEAKGIIVSRDPFSRLYSAYVDKSFLNFWTKLGDLGVRDVNGNCSRLPDLKLETFQDFLDRILTFENGEDINFHWMPINQICSPCHISVSMHVKLEEINSDLQFVFKKIGFGPELQDIFRQTAERKENSLNGIVETVFMKMKDKLCLTKDVVAERLWKSFQIQGYIDQSTKFPRNEFLDILSDDSYISNPEAFMKLVSNELLKRPLSKLRGLKQRQAMLASAYSDIKPETINLIQDKYKLDFLLFDYSLLPPSI